MLMENLIFWRFLGAGGSYPGGKPSPIIFLSFPTLKTIKNHWNNRYLTQIPYFFVFFRKITPASTPNINLRNSMRALIEEMPNIILWSNWCVTYDFSESYFFVNCQRESDFFEYFLGAGPYRGGKNLRLSIFHCFGPPKGQLGLKKIVFWIHY